MMVAYWVCLAWRIAVTQNADLKRKQPAGMCYIGII